MDSVKLQCFICCSVGEIKNTFLQPADVVTIVPIVELHSCKHQICATCVRKIRQRRRHVECPMCRHENTHITVYSVNRNVVEAIRCGVGEVRELSNLNGMLDAASLARNVFERSILLETEYNNNEPAITPENLRSTLTRLQEQINEQTKINYNLYLQSQTLTQTNEAIERRIEKSRNDYNDVCKQMEAIRNIRIKEERALKKLADKRTQWVERNAKLEQENKQLTNENIELIKDYNLFKKC